MFLPVWLTNFVAACGLALSTAAYGGLQWRAGGFGSILQWFTRFSPLCPVICCCTTWLCQTICV